MAKTFAPKDVELLGYSTAIAHDDEHGAYTVIDATANIGLETVRTQFVYLKSKSTQEDARLAARRLPREVPVHVIKPNSSRIGDRQLRNIFGTTLRSIRSHEDLIWEKLENMFTKYLDSLSNVHNEEHFIPPRSRDPLISDQLVSKLIEHMSGRGKASHGKPPRPFRTCRRRKDHIVPTPDPQARYPPPRSTRPFPYTSKRNIGEN